MKRNKLLRYAAIPAIGFVVLLIVVFFLQLSMTLSRQQENSRVKFEQAKNRISAYVKEEKKDWKSFDAFMQSKASKLMVDTLGSTARTPSELNEIREKWGLEGLYIVDGDQQISANRKVLSEHAIQKF